MSRSPGGAGKPLYLKLDARDNVAIVANTGGLAAGTTFADGFTLVDDVPQSHKVIGGMS